MSLQLDRNDPEAVAEALPPYPHGPARWYKQSRLGLYGGQRIQFGNNVGEKIEVKSRRSWHPSILTRRLFSKSLDRPVQVRVSARVLRTIDKLGGLDEYLLGEKEGRIKALGESGWWLRWAIMQTQAVKARFAEERARLGLPAQEENLGVATTEVVIEDASEADLEAAVEDGEAVATDGAFEVEQTSGLPPLKFRVGPGKHIVLTPTGWHRTRPSKNRSMAKSKAKIVEYLKIEEISEIQQQTADLESAVSSYEGHEHLSQQDVQHLRRRVTKANRQSLERKAEEIFTQNQELRKERLQRNRSQRVRPAPQEDGAGLVSLE